MPARNVEAGDLGFNVVDEGDGPPVLLLHGFPDTSSVWRHQIPALVSAGFRVIAPDLRGRGESDVAEGVDDYAMAHLIRDVAGIMDGLGVEKAAVVGHDWGSALAWLVAAFAPERVDRLVALSVGHPSRFSRRTIEDLRKGWYLWVFKFEGVAEQLLTQNNWEIFKEWLSGQADPNDYLDDLARPGRLTAGLNWYRANIAPEGLVGSSFQFPPISCPVLALHGIDDFALDEAQIAESGEFVTGPFRYERVEAGHWLQLDQPDHVNQLLLEFLHASY